MNSTYEAEAMALELTIVNAVVSVQVIVFGAPIFRSSAVASVLRVLSVGNASINAIPAPEFDSRKDNQALVAA